MARNHKAIHESARAQIRESCTGVVELDKATIYSSGLLGVVRREVKGLTIGRGPYAQYTNAVRSVFVMKGKRKPRGTAGGYEPYYLVLEGYGHDLDQKTMVTLGISNGMTTLQGKYSACDSRWQTDFQTQAEEWLKANPAVKVAFAEGWTFQPAEGVE